MISPDSNYVYVAAEDGNGRGAIAELARNADGTLTPISGHACMVEPGTASPCPDSGTGIEASLSLAISPPGETVYAVSYFLRINAAADADG